ncbi:MAG: DUF4347 domain-containing protein, partial [Planctomycetes bacterium]|nr:DUF4347 domain-containing protein [Planctomycetota bacterium]
MFNFSSDTSGIFYSDAFGNETITQATISTDSSTATVYYRDNTFGTPTITAARASGMTLGSDTKNIRIRSNLSDHSKYTSASPASSQTEGDRTELHRPNEIAVVDSSLADYQVLVEAAEQAGMEVILLSSRGDGVAEMAAALAGRSGIEALHIFSHGSNGRIILGEASLNNDTLDAYGDELAVIRQSLSEEGDILLYGCNVAADDEGQTFVNRLAEITQGDVAASDDITGAVSLRGDWILEEASGPVSSSAISSDLLNTFTHILATPASITTFDIESGWDNIVSGPPPVIAEDVLSSGWDFSADGDGDSSTRVQYWDEYANVFGRDAVGFSDAGSITQLLWGQIASNDGSDFTLYSIGMRLDYDPNSSTDTMTFIGYRDGSQVAGATSTFNLSSSPSGTFRKWKTYNFYHKDEFANIDALRIVPPAGVEVSSIFIDSIKINPPRISSATYDPDTGLLVVSGVNFTAFDGANNDIVANKFMIVGEGGDSLRYTLTNTDNVEITSATEFRLSLSATDKDEVNQILNKGGTSSTDGTSYALRADSGFLAAFPSASDNTGSSGSGINGIDVLSVPPPSITSATYDNVTGELVVTGDGFTQKYGSWDIVADQFPITGEGWATYTLTDTPGVGITSATSFTLTLSTTDKAEVNALINNAGTSSTGGTPYNLAAAEDWAAGADATVDIADQTGNGITATVKNNPPSITSTAITSVDDDSVYSYTLIG